MILVLLTRFCGSDESIVGYKLCQTLVKEDHDIYVTTVSTGEALGAEMKDVMEMNKKEKGNVTLFCPDYAKNEEPNPEWIVMHHEKYFNFLSELDDVKVIIGMLAGTEETARELKVVLKCRLILLSSSKTKTRARDHAAIQNLTESVDEIWSIGSDIHSHNEAIFQNVKHKEILLLPFALPLTDTGKNDSNALNFVSVWKNPVPMFQFRQQIHSKGSKITDFSSVSSAFDSLSDQFRAESRINWTIHCSQPEYIESLEKPDAVNISVNTSIRTQELMGMNCVNIVPDVQEETFNFTALSTIWLGIPL